LQTSLNNLTQDYSSFDRCMSQNYCKIPFIIACVVGGLIVFSLVMCCVRCVLCGYACCSCCCGGCGGRPHRRRDRSHEYDSSPPPFAQQQQQQQQPQPQPIIIQQPIIQQQPGVNEPPQYAYFDSKGDDCLPHMPSVQKERMVVESHEMGNVGARGRALDPHSGLIKRAASPAPTHYDYEPVSPVMSYYSSQDYNHPSVLLAAPPPAATGVMPQRTLSGDSGYSVHSAHPAFAHPSPSHPAQFQYPPDHVYDPHANRAQKEWTAV
jgi:hypothetical protein